MNNLTYYIAKSDPSSLIRRSGLDEVRFRLITEGADPDYSELVIFSKLFGMSISKLLADYSSRNETAALFRKQQGSQETGTLIDKISILVDGIMDYSPSKSVDLSKIGSGINSFENAEETARKFREIFLDNNQLDSITALPELLANLGVIIQVTELGEKVDGSCARVQGVNFIFLSPRFPGRMLMSLAHELGHLINHIGKESFIVIEPQNSNEYKINRLQEDFATHFASSLLLPAQGVARTIVSIRQFFKIELSKPVGDIEIIYIAHYYGLSFEATAQRLEILGLIPKGGAFSLSDRVKKDYGSPEKRAKELQLTDRDEINFKVLPQTLLKNVFAGLDNGDYSIGQICQNLNLTISELHNLHQN
jgi:Zn-dependent peptidase ImmA (M78 family)